MTATATAQTLPDEAFERAKSLELDTPYVPPPGDALAHHAAGYAKIMCSAIAEAERFCAVYPTDPVCHFKDQPPGARQ
jgi:hypothetical protein